MRNCALFLIVQFGIIQLNASPVNPQAAENLAGLLSVGPLSSCPSPTKLNPLVAIRYFDKNYCHDEATDAIRRDKSDFDCSMAGYFHVSD
jgi:hypothetical protein